MHITKLRSGDASYAKPCSYNPLEAENYDYGNLIKSWKTTEKSVIKFELWKTPLTWSESYHFWKEIWKQEQMSTIKGYPLEKQQRFRSNFGGNATK